MFSILKRILPLFAFLLCFSVSSQATGFTHAQASGLANAVGGSPYTLGAILSGNPATGDLVVCTVGVQANTTLTSFKDSNNNSYTASPLSPNKTTITNYQSLWLVYLLSAPSNATGTFTMATPANSTAIVICDDFTVTGGTAAFVNDFSGSGTTATSPSTTPTVTPSAAGNLLYSGIAGSSHTLTGVGGGWTENSGGVVSQNDIDAAYILSSGAGGVAVAFTWTGSRNYNTLGMAFSFTPSGAGAGSKVAGPSKIAGPAKSD